MTDRAKPSGPLWATTNDAGVLSHYSTITNEQPGDQPCRLIPGHGKVVPVELVEAIAKECARIDPDGYHGRLVDLVEVALGGAM